MNSNKEQKTQTKKIHAPLYRPLKKLTPEHFFGRLHKLGGPFSISSSLFSFGYVFLKIRSKYTDKQPV